MEAGFPKPPWCALQPQINICSGPFASWRGFALGQGLLLVQEELNCESQKWLRWDTASEQGKGTITCAYSGSASEVVQASDCGWNSPQHSQQSMPSPCTSPTYSIVQFHTKVRLQWPREELSCEGEKLHRPREEIKKGKRCIWWNDSWKLPKPEEGNKYLETGNRVIPNKMNPNRSLSRNTIIKMAKVRIFKRLCAVLSCVWLFMIPWAIAG